MSLYKDIMWTEAQRNWWLNYLRSGGWFLDEAMES
jgi:hypothetical protein